jgi:hypothetical protein
MWRLSGVTACQVAMEVRTDGENSGMDAFEKRLKVHVRAESCDSIWRRHAQYHQALSLDYL